jgi:hypothetical protein
LPTADTRPPVICTPSGERPLSRMISPLREAIESARSTPRELTTPFDTSEPLVAISATRPPLACIVPLFTTLL